MGSRPAGPQAVAPVHDTSRFVADDVEPAYLDLYRRGLLEARVEAALEELRDCCVCPRDCHVDRLADERSLCHSGRHAPVASVFAHFGEEDCLRGHNGSGTIFFAWCNLRCVFCQNWDISQQDAGRPCSADEIATFMLQLQEQGCHNINFVTPEHVAPNVIEAIAAAVPRGLRLPIVYNTSAYDSLRSLELLDGLVDVYMPDFKFWDPDAARRLARARDYPEVARRAVAEMHRQVGPLIVGSDGLARRGLLVRHLVMPGMTDDAAHIMRWLADEISPDTYVNLMGQYRPDHKVPDRESYVDIGRRPTGGELAEVRAVAEAAGLWRFDQR